MVDVLPPGTRAQPASNDLVSRGRRAWPGIVVPEPTFIAFVLERLGDRVTDPAAWVSLHVSDLYLSCACVALDDAAATAFVERFTPDVDGVFRPDRSAEPKEDFRQSVFEHLLVPAQPTVPPRIANYRGIGNLRYWVRIVAARRLRPAPPQLEAALLPGPADPPETAYLREYYREPFQQAVQEAFETLGARERSLLRLQLVDGMPVMAIAAMLQVHRVSVSRWLRAARSDLLSRTRELMRRRFGVPIGELSSVVRLARGALDASPRSVLGDHEPPGRRSSGP